MKLKEKFDVISCKHCDMPFCDSKCTMLSDLELNKLEQIAEEFAINFAEWLRINYYDNGELWIECNNDKNSYSSKDLLQEFKKEKGL